MLSFHDAGSEEESSSSVTTHWHLQVRQTPDGAPPSEVEEATKKSGGAFAVLNRLAVAWAAERTTSIRLTASFQVDLSVYKIRDVIAHPRRRARIRQRGEKQQHVLAPLGSMWQISGESSEDGNRLDPWSRQGNRHDSLDRLSSPGN